MLGINTRWGQGNQKQAQPKKWSQLETKQRARKLGHFLKEYYWAWESKPEWEGRGVEGRGGSRRRKKNRSWIRK